jgi:hypothetical protein
MIFQNCPQISQIGADDFSNCPQISQIVADDFSNCPQITQIVADDFSKLSADFADEWKWRVSQCGIIDVSHCSQS